jgi:hypothetical protein
MVAKLILVATFSFLGGALLFSSTRQVFNNTASAHDDRTADREAIRQHISSIFQAFIDRDVDKIYATHSEDWRGFLEGSRVPIKGIDEYMRANGIDWPASKGSKPSPDPNTGYRMKDFDVMFYGPELAVACFNGEFETRTNTPLTLNRFRIMDVYAKRNGNWIQVASHTVVDPEWKADQATKPLNVTPRMRERILAAREAVWKAYFANDKATLDKVIPQEVIAIDGDSTGFSDRATIMAGAQRFADGGGKLIKLEFPKTEMQVYGNAVVLYTTYSYELESGGKRTTKSGTGTEIFVRRGNDLVNVGWHLD